MTVRQHTDSSTPTTPSAEVTAAAAWSAVDEAFFRIVARVFPPEFVEGAGVLLGSYDPEQ